MSRWTDQSENQALKNNWNTICDFSKELDAAKAASKSEVDEIAHFKKVAVYITGLMKACDPDFVPLETWQTINTYLNACLPEMASYTSSKNLQNLINANSHLDNLLRALTPYVPNAKEAAKAAGAAYKEFLGVFERERNSLLAQNTQIIKDMDRLKTEAEDKLEKIGQAESKISAFKTRLVGEDDDQDCIEKEIDKTLERIEEKENIITKLQEEIEAFHEILTVGKDEEDSLVRQISDAKTEIFTDSDEAKKKLETFDDQMLKLDAFHVKVFGNKDEKGEYSGGLKQEIENRQRSLDTFAKDQRTKYDTIIKEIEGLLPGAASSGLASAYEKMKRGFDAPITWFTRAYYLAMFVLISIPVMFLLEVLFKQVPRTEFTAIDFILIRAAAAIPIIWFALFVTKRRSELQRLQQEYAHKAVLAQSYISFKQQIQDLKDKDNILMKKLLDAVIDTVGYNASKTLDGKHGDSPPAQDLAEKAIDACGKALEKFAEKWPFTSKPQ